MNLNRQQTADGRCPVVPTANFAMLASPSTSGRCWGRRSGRCRCPAWGCRPSGSRRPIAGCPAHPAFEMFAQTLSPSLKARYRTLGCVHPRHDCSAGVAHAGGLALAAAPRALPTAPRQRHWRTAVVKVAAYAWGNSRAPQARKAKEVASGKLSFRWSPAGAAQCSTGRLLPSLPLVLQCLPACLPAYRPPLHLPAHGLF